MLLRGTSKRPVTFQPKRTRVDLSSWSWFIGALGALIFAAIIAWRRPALVEARILCLLPIAQVVWVCLYPIDWITPSATLDFGAVLVGDVVYPLATALLVAYTLLFGRPLSTIRKAIAAFAFLIISFDLLYGLAADLGTSSAAFDLYGGPIGQSVLLTFWIPLASYLLPLLAIAAAIAAARGRARSLLVWTTATWFVIGCAGAASTALGGSARARGLVDACYAGIAHSKGERYQPLVRSASGRHRT